MIFHTPTILSKIGMVKINIFLCILFLFSSCTSSNKNIAPSTGSTVPDGFFVTPPQPAFLTIVGVSSRQLKRETEIENARIDAARKVSMYQGVKGIFESEHNIGSGFWDYYVALDSKIEYDENLEPYLEQLSYNQDRDVVLSDRGIFIRFTYPAIFPEHIVYSSDRNPDGKPVWINKPPREFSGFTAGVGFSARQYRFQDTFVKSCEAAVIAIVNQLSTIITTRNVSSGYQNTSITNQRSEGSLVNFVVLEIWIDPETQAVWTLAIAQSTN